MTTSNPYDGSYQLIVTVIQSENKFESSQATAEITTTLNGAEYLLDSSSKLTMLDESYTLSGSIDSASGVASISGKAIGADYKLEEGNCLFTSSPSGVIVSGSMIFDGGPMIGFRFFLGGFSA